MDKQVFREEGLLVPDCNPLPISFPAWLLTMSPFS